MLNYHSSGAIAYLEPEIRKFTEEYLERNSWYGEDCLDDFCWKILLKYQSKFPWKLVKNVIKSVVLERYDENEYDEEEEKESNTSSSSDCEEEDEEEETLTHLDLTRRNLKFTTNETFNRFNQRVYNTHYKFSDLTRSEQNVILELLNVYSKGMHPCHVNTSNIKYIIINKTCSDDNEKVELILHYYEDFDLSFKLTKHPLIKRINDHIPDNEWILNIDR